MVDFAMDVHKGLYPDQDVPPTLVDKRAKVVEQFKQLQAETDSVMKILNEPEVIRQIQQSRDSKQLLDFLVKGYDFKPSMVDTCYNFAKFQYECGNYSGASEYLYFHRILVQPTDKNYLNGMWGKLAAEILMQDWDTALEDLNRLKQFIDESTFGSNLQTLQQRTWLIHWSLFVFFNHPKGRDLIKVIQEESYTYRDPITSFIEDLYVNFDFDGAQQKLRDCETVLVNDFFLVACLQDFIENSRMMIFETFCRIHQCISISMLAEKLNMSTEEAERWIVNLIRNAKLDAKIDSKQGTVVMGVETNSPYQQLIEKTKGLMYRTQMVVASIDKKLATQQKNSTSFTEPFVHWGAYE